MTEQDDLAAVAADWVEAAAEAEKAKTRAEELADYLRAHMKPGEQVTTADGVKVGVVQGAARWDADKARELLTEDQLNLITVLVHSPSKEMAKRFLPGVLVDQLHTRTRPSVKVVK